MIGHLPNPCSRATRFRVEDTPNDWPSFKCPKCGRDLACAGVLTVHLEHEDREVPTYQCDECLMTIDLGGTAMEVALTFAVDKNGQAFDPADPEGRLRF